MRKQSNDTGGLATKAVRPERSRGALAKRVSTKFIQSGAAGGAEGLDTNGDGVVSKERTPERTCILTRRKGTKDRFIRLALGPDGQVAPDVRAKAPGRGAWISVSRTELDEASAKGKLKAALARAFKANSLSVPDDLGARTESALRQAALDRLGMEARSGNLINGSDKVEQAARMGKVRVLIHAADAGEDGNRRLDQAFRVGGGEGRGLIFPEGRSILSMALGRENVVHIALTDPAAAERVSNALARWRAFTDPEAGLDGATNASGPALTDDIEDEGTE